ncbi:uncharacterized protein LOC128883333 [Hylaeus volcanicus]|uniref:uncharacterized protein LOC128883333 n=1 Tax=Hylaeus volcanicus TaxID=313075 RepID=UPI0023B7B996|nr:uncharacterized protein LOC128883333 [Hylaeus volcanicus]
MSNLSENNASGWCQWPGAVDLSRVNRTLPTSLQQDSNNSRVTRRGSFRNFSNMKMFRGMQTEPNVCFQKKVRILFTWKPPALSASEVENSSNEQDKHDLNLNKNEFSNVVLLYGVPWWMTDCDVRELASVYGHVRAVRVLGDFLTGASTGLALFEYTKKNSFKNLIADQGLRLKSFGDTSLCNIQFHILTTKFLTDILSVSKDESSHWSFGTFFDSKVYEALNSLVQGSQDTAFNVNETMDHTLEREKVCIKEEKRPLVKTCHSPVVVQAQQKIQPLCKHIAVQTEIYLTQMPASSDQCKEKNQEINKKAKFMFPFAAAAVVARVLRDELSENSLSNRNSYANNSCFDSSKHNNEDTFDEEMLDRIDKTKIPFWGAPLNAMIRLPAPMPSASSEVMSSTDAIYKMYPEASMRPRHGMNPEGFPVWGPYAPGVPTLLDVQPATPFPMPMNPCPYVSPDNGSAHYPPYM